MECICCWRKNGQNIHVVYWNSQPFSVYAVWGTCNQGNKKGVMELNMQLTVIPWDLASQMQPLNTLINKSLNAVMHEEWTNGMEVQIMIWHQKEEWSCQLYLRLANEQNILVVCETWTDCEDFQEA
jgi:hypothetical protein